MLIKTFEKASCILIIATNSYGPEKKKSLKIFRFVCFLYKDNTVFSGIISTEILSQFSKLQPISLIRDFSITTLVKAFPRFPLIIRVKPIYICITRFEDDSRVQYVIFSFTRLMKSIWYSVPGGGGEATSIHSLKWNPNDVLTTCKAIIEAIASGFVKC